MTRKRPEFVMGRVNKEQLTLALARVGWSWADLQKKTGLAHSTFIRIRRGEPVKARTIHQILSALQAEPPSELAERLFLEA